MRSKPLTVSTATVSKSLLGLSLLALPVTQSLAVEVPTVSVGAGMRTSFTNTNPEVGDSTNDFKLNSARIYLSSKVTDKLSFMFNTEYDGNNVGVLDAAAQFSFSDKFNIWAGRFIAPSDRANLYGPYYASNWNVYQDGVQDGYPSATINGMPTGRDDGVMYWGQFGKAKFSAGVFDVPSTTDSKKVLYASRLQFDFWDQEGGYYLNGTYYGEKDLLALGVAVEGVSSDNAYSVDGLLEKKLGNGGVVTLEAEYAKYDGLGGYTGKKSDGYYGLVGYLFPEMMGPGKVQVLAKYGKTKYDFDDGEGGTFTTSHKTLELNVNYLIKAFGARLSLFYLNKNYDVSGADSKQIGLGLQVQM
jgi:hypothetical protein